MKMILLNITFLTLLPLPNLPAGGHPTALGRLILVENRFGLAVAQSFLVTATINRRVVVSSRLSKTSSEAAYKKKRQNQSTLPTAPPHEFMRGKISWGTISPHCDSCLDSLPPISALHASIDTFHTHTARADLLELQESRRGNWLKYLPTLGLAYTPSGAPRPGLSYSTTVIYQAKKDKQTRAAKRLAILEQAQLAARRDKAALGPLLERHRSAERELAAALRLLELDRELLSYWQQELAAKNIGPVEFLGKRKAFMEQETGIERLRDRLRELEAELLAKAHFFDP